MDATKQWRDLPMKFATHVVVGALMFMLIGVTGVLLHYFVSWMAAVGLPEWSVLLARYVEYALFSSDILLFGTFMVRTVVHYGLSMIRAPIT